MPLFSNNLSSKIDIDVTLLFRLVSFQMVSLKEASHSCVELGGVIASWNSFPPSLAGPASETDNCFTANPHIET